MVRAHCSVLVDALLLCVSLDSCAEIVWLRIITRLTCTTVEHGSLQTVAVMVKLSSDEKKNRLSIAFCCDWFVGLCLLTCIRISTHTFLLFLVFFSP